MKIIELVLASDYEEFYFENSHEVVPEGDPDSIAVIGLDLSRARLRAAIEVLGGISKKQAKNLEKEFAQLG